MGWNGVYYDPARLQELYALVNARIELLLTGREYAAPIRVFVKPEPHKQAKLDSNRLRLISAVAFEDAMVDRIIFRWLMKAALSTVGKTPSMVGWVPLFGSWRAIRTMFPKKALCLDKSAWDWTVQGWMTTALKIIVKELMIDSPAWLRRLVDVRFSLLFDKPTFQFPDGSRVTQPYPGIMKSGCYLTILLNTVSQVLLHFLAAERSGVGRSAVPKALGDDTLQDGNQISDLPKYVQAIESFGVKVKGFKLRSDVEFAGFQMVDDRCAPAYYKKHLYKMEYSDHLPEYLYIMQLLYARDPPMYSIFREAAKVRCPQSVVPQHLARRLMDGV